MLPFLMAQCVMFVGSSAGPAAAVAAGLVAFSVGTETAGSIIEPSATNVRNAKGRSKIYTQCDFVLYWFLKSARPGCAD